MSLTIGFTEIECGPDSDSEVRGDDFWSFVIDIDTGSLAESNAMQQQLRGYQTQGDGIPVYWTDDPSINGFYVMRSCRITPSSNYLSTGRMKAEITLERAGHDFANPLVDVVAVASERASGAEGSRFIPGSWRHQTLGNVDSRIRTLFGGGSAVGGTASVAGGNTEILTYGYSVTPEDFYEASCAVEYFTDGRWVRSAGRSLEDVSSSEHVRISNGFIRFTYLTDGTLQFEVANATEWVVFAEFGSYVDGNFIASRLRLPASAPVVTRNDPCTVTLRFPTRYDLTSSNSTRYLDVSIRRGQSFASMVINEEGTHGLAANATTPATVTTIPASGVHSTSVDANGHRWVAGSLALNSTDLIEGRFTTITKAFYIGVSFDGGVGIGDDPSDVNRQWLLPISERQKVSGQ